MEVGVKQSFFIEVLHSSCKRFKLFFWIIFVGEDIKLPFVNPIKPTIRQFWKGSICFMHFFTVPWFSSIFKFSLAEFRYIVTFYMQP